MSVTARITPTWKKLRLVVGLVPFIYGFFFFYDGASGWPKSNERFRRYHEFVDAGDVNGWKAYAGAQGWTSKPPEKLHTRLDIIGQFIYGTVGTVGGLIILLYWLSQIKRTIELNDDAVIAPSGKRVPFTNITGLGLKKWDSKGLASVRYEIDGRAGKFTIDDYKYDPDACRTIVDELKRQLEARAAV